MGYIFPLILVFVIVGILGTCVAVTGLTVFRGIKRLRFSLGALVGTVFSGGLCVTLLTFPRESVPFMFGAWLTTLYLVVLSSHILGLGALSDAEYHKQRQDEQTGAPLM